MNILLLNLTRFGDLLQSQAAVTDLVCQGHRVGLVCLQNFSGAAALLKGLSALAPLPGAALLALLRPQKGSRRPPGERREEQPGWPQAVADLEAWREELYSDFAPDAICNLTPTLAARLLALYLARGGPCAGFTVDANGFGLNSNAWAAFLQGAASERGISPFNVVDIFRRVALPDNPCRDPGDASLQRPGEDALAAMRALIEQEAPPGCRGFAALQLGASEDRRRWPVASFAAVGRRLWEEAGVCPVLLGSAAETELAASCGRLLGRAHVNLCGRTDAGELAAALCATRLLVTNDTGTMHLAAGLNVPVLALFLATAQPFDTGPYGEGNCSLEPDLDCHPCAFGTVCPHDLVCRRAVSPDIAAGLALRHLADGRWTSGGEAGVFPGARVWLSRFDPQGFLDLDSLSGHGSSARRAWFALQRHCLRGFLDRERGARFVPEAPEGLPPLPEAALCGIAAAAGRAADYIPLLLQQGRLLESRGPELMRQRFLATWQRVLDALGAEPRLRVLAMLWVQATQDSGQDLPHVLDTAEDFGLLLREIAGGNARRTREPSA